MTGRINGMHKLAQRLVRRLSASRDRNGREEEGDLTYLCVNDEYTRSDCLDVEVVEMLHIVPSSRKVPRLKVEERTGWFVLGGQAGVSLEVGRSCGREAVYPTPLPLLICPFSRPPLAHLQTTFSSTHLKLFTNGTLVGSL